MDYNLLDLAAVFRSIGRGVVFYAHAAGDVTTPVRWDPGLGEPLNLAHLGDTEGDITLNRNQTVAPLTLPEISGGAQYEATFTGENPVLDTPLFLADPALLPIVSPSGGAGGGYGRVAPAAERTIVVFPERLFKNAGDATTGYGELTFVGGVWTIGGVALSAEQLRYLGMSVWLWRVYAVQASRRFLGGHGDAAKNIETVSWNALMHPDLPEGQRLYTEGDPADFGIDIEGGS